MVRVKEMIENLDYDELIKVKKDIDCGSIHLKKLIENKITDKEKEHNIECSVCGKQVDPNSTTTFTLIFGPDGFKKKATFCAEDCLHYFLATLKEIKENS